MQHIPGPAIEQVLDVLQLLPANGTEVGILREELADETVCILVGATLSGAPWIGEVDLHVRLGAEETMSGHLAAPVIGQGELHLLRLAAGTSFNISQVVGL